MKVGLLLIPLAVVLAACGGHSESDSARFAQAVLTRQLNGDPGFAWVRLHPVERQLVTRERYSRCVLGGLGDTPPQAKVELAGEQPVAIDRRGVREHQAERVKLRVTLFYPTTKYLAAAHWPVDVVRDRDRLTWLLDASTGAQYRRFRAQPRICPE